MRVPQGSGAPMPKLVMLDSPVSVEGSRLRQLTETFRMRRSRFVQRKTYAFYQCSCGGVKVINHYRVSARLTKSCGCLSQENGSAHFASLNLVHGDSGSPEHNAYRAMLNRCAECRHQYNKIYVCNRWLIGEDGLSGYECFRKDMGPKPGPEYSLDRKDPDKNYEPGNCRWLPLPENNSRARRDRNW